LAYTDSNFRLSKDHKSTRRQKFCSGNSAHLSGGGAFCDEAEGQVKDPLEVKHRYHGSFLNRSQMESVFFERHLKWGENIFEINNFSLKFFVLTDGTILSQRGYRFS
jgi:hypothetical protein